MKIVGINKEYSSPFSTGIGSIYCSYERLNSLFGEPKKDVGYKSDYEWTLNMENGDHINIYDWKVGKNYLGKEDGLEKKTLLIGMLEAITQTLFTF